MSTLKVDGIRSNSASSDAITLASNGTCTANLSNRQNRNLIINGAMKVAQRGTDATGSGANGFATVDRFEAQQNGTDAYIEQHQVNVASGTTPYTLGFRKAFQIKNGTQSSGAGAADYVIMRTELEAQDIANSGWNYTSASSYVTLQFWVKSSVAQNFYGYIRTYDGTAYHYPFETGSLSANTWTKVTTTIPGNSNLTFNNDNGVGLQFNLLPFFGTDYTSSSTSLGSWYATGSGDIYTPDNTTTWYTTADSTLELTGLQLEVGSVATDFEHKSFSQDFELCKRYYQKDISTRAFWGSGNVSGRQFPVRFEKEMRATPSISFTNTTIDGGGSFSASQASSQGYNHYMSSSGRFFEWRVIAEAEL